MKSTALQRQRIHALSHYQKGRKVIDPTEFRKNTILQITKDEKRLSTVSLSFDEANEVIIQLGGTPELRKNENWAKPYDTKNKRHMYIFSLCHQAGKTVTNKSGRLVADLDWLSNFLKKDAPIKKPLHKQNGHELSKNITALEGVVEWIHKNKK